MTKILIAEDDQFIANAYRVKFEKEGFEVLITSDGEEAISSLESFAPDLIILDLVMPKKDGFITLSEIKANPKYANIPVIVTSNLSQSTDFDKVKSLGAVEYLVKSETPIGEIVNKIRTYL
jgi:DNA-binding response OmpR family regulator